MKPSLVFAVPLLCIVPSLAWADPPPPGDAAAAQSLFNDGRALMTKGRYAEACPKLEESLRLDHGIGTAFNLADCHEHIGKIATAWAGFLSVAAQAKAKRQLEREALAKKRAQMIERRVPKLVIDATAAVPGIEVKRDGVVVGAASWGSEIAVDPGPHRVTASAPGHAPWETTIDVAEGKIARVVVPRELPAAPVAVTEPRPQPGGRTPRTPPRAESPPLVVPPQPQPIVENPGSKQRVIGYAVAGLGVAGLAVGGAFGLASMSKRDDASTHCNAADICDARGVALRDDAMRAGDISTVTTIAGAAALVGGIVLVLTSPRSSRRGGLPVAPTVASTGGGLLLQGTLP